MHKWTALTAHDGNLHTLDALEEVLRYCRLFLSRAHNGK